MKVRRVEEPAARVGPEEVENGFDLLVQGRVRRGGIQAIILPLDSRNADQK